LWGLEEKNKKIKNKGWIYFLKIARIKLMIAPTTTTHPATIVIIDGIAGIVSVPSIIPEPTASADMIPTIHVNIPTMLPSFIFTSFKIFFFSLWRNEKISLPQ